MLEKKSEKANLDEEESETYYIFSIDEMF